MSKDRVTSRRFQGILRGPGEGRPGKGGGTGTASFGIENPSDVRELTTDEDWFGWAEGKEVILTISLAPPKRAKR